MAVPSLDKLEEALQLLEKEVASRRRRLEAAVAKKLPLAPEDELWLDNDANLVDERRAVESLKGVSNYAAGLEKLSEGEKAAVARLSEMVQGQGKGKGGSGAKRKRA